VSDAVIVPADLVESKLGEATVAGWIERHLLVGRRHRDEVSANVAVL
jgi:hypothetical protein